MNKKKKNHSFKMSPGLFMVIISNLGWLGALVIPVLNFISPAAKAFLIPAFIIGGQILWYGGLLLLGKKVAARFIAKKSLRKIFKKLTVGQPRRLKDSK